MTLLQNLLITDNVCFFLKSLNWKPSHKDQYELESGKAVDVTSLPNLYTFNTLSLLLESVTILAATTNRNMESGKSCETTYMIRLKGSERRPFIFIFRLNIVLHDSYQADEIIMEIKECKENVACSSVKSFSRVLLIVLETSIVS